MTEDRKILVTTFVKNLLGGGAERVAVNLLQGLPQDIFRQELVMVSGWGPFLEHVPEHVETTDLALSGGVKGQGNVSASIGPLVRYLRQHKPDILISHLAHANIAATIAVALARTNTKVVLVEHNDNSLLDKDRRRSRASQVMQAVKRQVYRRADRLVGVSEGVSHYISATFGVPTSRISTIYNPVINSDLLAKAEEPLEHPWFAVGEPPVLLASGRLREQKDFITLLRAFAKVREQRPCRLIILGEGQERAALEAEVAALGLTDAVQLPGFVSNPYPYMRAASMFVLSSRWEGLPTVLIEAMACGCPVVATNCPSGPDEILESGKWGPLVPVADPDGLADAILKSFAAHCPPDVLRQRAKRFSFERAMSDYTSLLETLARPYPPPNRSTPQQPILRPNTKGGLATEPANSTEPRKMRATKHAKPAPAARGRH